MPGALVTTWPFVAPLLGIPFAADITPFETVPSVEGGIEESIR